MARAGRHAPGRAIATARSGIRVRLGHALIGAGNWLAGERGSYEPLRALLASKGFFEAATFNELETDEGVVEADKLWLRRDRDAAGARR